jgi:hypothetical protein
MKYSYLRITFFYYSTLLVFYWCSLFVFQLVSSQELLNQYENIDHIRFVKAKILVKVIIPEDKLVDLPVCSLSFMESGDILTGCYRCYFIVVKDVSMIT